MGKPTAGRDPASPEDWTYVATIPALVSQADFDEVQAKLVWNQQHASRNNKAHAYLLRALVSCGQCQSACTALTSYSGHSYYRCWRSTRRLDAPPTSRCQARYSPANQLDALVWQDLCEILAHPESIAYALERAHGGHWLPQELQARKETLHKAQMALTHQLDRLTEAYLIEVIPLAEYQRRRQALAQKQQALAAQEKQLEAQVDRQGEIAGMVTSIEAFCQRVRTGLAEATFEQKRTLVELLIDRVLVANGDVEIRYAIPIAPRGETSRFCQLRKDYFQMPFVAWLGASTLQPICVVLPELQTPLTDGLVRHIDTAFKHHLFDVAIAQGEAVIEPDAMADDLAGKAVILVAGGISGWRHIGCFS
jgi:site-specific DNA recombinase